MLRVSISNIREKIVLEKKIQKRSSTLCNGVFVTKNSKNNKRGDNVVHMSLKYSEPHR